MSNDTNPDHRAEALRLLGLAEQAMTEPDYLRATMLSQQASVHAQISMSEQIARAAVALKHISGHLGEPAPIVVDVSKIPGLDPTRTEEDIARDLGLPR